MITEFETVHRDTPLREVAVHILAGFQQDFPVVEDGRVVGVLTKSDLLKAWAEGERNEPIEHFMRDEFETASPHEMLTAAFQRLQQCRCHTLPVVERGQLVGLIDMENVGEFIALQSAARRAEFKRTHQA
jgi:predicted transcriptional regulator